MTSTTHERRCGEKDSSTEETIVWVELTREQRIYYRAVYENNVGTLLKGSTSSDVSSLRNVAMELRKVCNHPFLCDGFKEDYASKHGASRRMCGKDGKNVISTQNPLQEASGKMILVDKLLPMLKGMGRRVLIFSKFTMMLDLLEDYLLSKAYTYERIDGNIRGSDRQAAIDRYSATKSNIVVFLLNVDVEMNRNIESLLKHGAYDILKDDSDAAAAEFSAQNIHEILEPRTQERLIGGRGANTFSVATNTERDPEPAEELKPELEKGSKEFWKDLLSDACKASEVPVEKVQTTPAGS
ncbi:hypothetical protein AXG93_93s1000 [Marchantia polymorpha subsp. ruderalis]|uniref:Helicase C-terminal domain-containing protein n=1 Tax=Marchantia polymorpha subsp. ruderalis TaxID=1480154 RepID=A0A176WUK0_MARPO|nr:hypothetical protein AXG93_93s1000 [Marchantia polymorpha subsp. ruderalis]